ncbi:MAG: hypothetical protein RL238_671 [Actinomycetota bacterium]|jgi:DNA-binding LacI/PurR family transcriptional regulator
MADVARAAGVSRALVSIVMRDAPGASAAMRQHVKETAAALGYRANTAAQVLRRSRSHNVGVLFSPRFPFEVEIVEAMYPAADAHGYTVVLGAMAGTRDLDEAVDELVGHRCEALVLVGLDRPDGWFEQVRGRLGLVRVGRMPSSAAVDVVRSDERRGVSVALRHLADLGHRRIAFVGGGTMPGASERAAAYRAGMRRLGLAAEVMVLEGDYTDEGGAAAARALLDGGTDVTAVLAANDWSAVGLLGELARRGVHVPTDVSVVGYDDSDLARRSYVDLTSVRQDPAALAAAAIAAVRLRLEQPDAPPIETVLPSRLVVRSSTAAPRR